MSQNQESKFTCYLRFW